MLEQVYWKYTIGPAEKISLDIALAVLAELGFDAFEEQEEYLVAAGVQSQVMEEAADTALEELSIPYTKLVVENENWNAIWESSFDPIIVDDIVAIRAEFHPPNKDVEYEVIITPKMSFGTGHHGTTYCVIQLMRLIDFNDKTVYDFGTGTGILGILAEKFGARYVLAADYDPWCIENATENIEANNSKNVEVLLADAPPEEGQFDIIIANINKHILLQFMQHLSHLQTGGNQLILSGLLIEDEKDILHAAAKNGYEKVQLNEKNGWIAILFNKTS
ncbi:50S ribosomal protein L11 methyltransferase [Polluticaenibacter yanchengensis]|uniref:50S ribosomal protein L11 methyltransferase n=1 Tax=Polluticaenibacter yanchengensis TaxID=3014562 RepID=A0ABT4UGI9_9BACT|nr:50S ribosomal protein L11 methyltransferase [Chitinophagaceae bacterium LY-5]